MKIREKKEKKKANMELPANGTKKKHNDTKHEGGSKEPKEKNQRLRQCIRNKIIK